MSDVQFYRTQMGPGCSDAPAPAGGRAPARLTDNRERLLAFLAREPAGEPPRPESKPKEPR